MKITLALLSLAAAASAYPMFLLEEEPLVYRAPRQMPQDRPFPLGQRRGDDLETAADAAYGAAPVSICSECSTGGPRVTWRILMLLTPALLCHKDTAQGNQSPPSGAILALKCVVMAYNLAPAL